MESGGATERSSGGSAIGSVLCSRLLGGARLAAETLAREGLDGLAVAAEVFFGYGGDAGDGPVAFEAGQQLADLRRARGTFGGEPQLERLPVEGWRGGQMGEAGAEHHRRAQCCDGEDRSQQGGSGRCGGAAAAPFKGMADSDQCTWHGDGTG